MTKNRLLIALLTLIFAQTVNSQTVQPTATPTPQNDEDVVKISTSLISG